MFISEALSNATYIFSKSMGSNIYNLNEGTSRLNDSILWNADMEKIIKMSLFNRNYMRFVRVNQIFSLLFK